MSEHSYIAIDLKSFYASVECRERGLDPLSANLVVVDKERSSKTICLAVSPSFKKLGLPGRCRLFEVEALVRKIKETSGIELKYVTARPRMALYMEYSARIYAIYLKYFSPEDIHVYSIDEVFIDVSGYLNMYGMTSRQLAQKVITEIFEQTGVTSTAGIAPNLYLAKIAMDIEAKHVEADANGVRIAELDEMSYRRKLWSHRPITDFWRVGKGIEGRLSKYAMFTMGDIARRSLSDPDQLYRIFGIDAEILIDHAWGYEPCTIKEIKNYKSSTKGIGSGQVLHCAYDNSKARIVLQEMAGLLALDLFQKNIITDSITIVIGYDIANLKDASFKGVVQADRYGREIPKSATGTISLGCSTNSARVISERAGELFDDITDKTMSIRRLSINANDVGSDDNIQLSLFRSSKEEKRDSVLQQAQLDITRKFGKNALLKAASLQDGSTLKDRNRQIGGHRS